LGAEGNQHRQAASRSGANSAAPAQPRPVTLGVKERERGGVGDVHPDRPKY